MSLTLLQKILNGWDLTVRFLKSSVSHSSQKATKAMSFLTYLELPYFWEEPYESKTKSLTISGKYSLLVHNFQQFWNLSKTPQILSYIEINFNLRTMKSDFWWSIPQIKIPPRCSSWGQNFSLTEIVKRK